MTRYWAASLTTRWVLPAAVMLSVAGGCGRGPAERVVQTRPVKTVVVSSSDGTVKRTFAGRVVAGREADLGFRVAGLLASLPVREGQRVKQGEVVAVLRQDEFRARLTSLQGQLTQAEAGLRALRAGLRPEERARIESQVRAAEARMQNAKAEFERFSELIRENAVARTEFELRETQYRVAQEDLKAARQLFEQSATGRKEDIDATEANVQSLRARVEEVQIQMTDSTLRAPFTGVIAQRFVEENQNIAVGQAVVRFQDSEEITVGIDVPESVMAADLTSKDIVGLMAEFSAVPGREFPVQIREVSQVADAVTQTFRVRAVMKTPEGLSLLPGMTATIRMTVRGGEAAGLVRVPLTAIYRGGSGEAVAWVVGDDLKARRRGVKLGAISGGAVEVVDGLKAGERIAIAGVSQLQEGLEVRVLSDGLGVRP
jgi:membrane fusion protein, multidrug efflux system